MIVTIFMNFFTNNFKNALRYLFILLYGVLAGLNLSLNLSAVMTLICWIGLLFQIQKTKSVFSFLFLWCLGFLVGSCYWIFLSIYDPVNSSLTMAFVVCLFVFLVHSLIYVATLFWLLYSYLLIKTMLNVCFFKNEFKKKSVCVAWNMQKYVNRNSLIVNYYKFLSNTINQLRYSYHSNLVIFLLPFSMALAEVARSLGFWAMPWGLLGYSQVNNPFLKGVFPVLGVYGVTLFFCLFASFVVYYAGQLVKLKNNTTRGYFDVIQLFWYSNNKSIISFVFLVFIMYTSQFISWTTKTSDTLKIRLVHTNLPNIQKYNQLEQQHAIGSLLKFSKLHDVDMTLYPELYIVKPAYLIDKSTRQNIVESIKSSNNNQIFGSPSRGVDINGNINKAHNSLIMLDKNSKTNIYSKEILIPFSEYTPNNFFMNWALPYIFKFPLSNFNSSFNNHLNYFDINNFKISPSLCNEMAYSFYINKMALNNNLLINSASDSWVPNKLYQLQSWRILKARALETQKPVVRSNNAGFSGWFLPNGEENIFLTEDENSVILNSYIKNTPFTLLVNFLN